MSNFSETLNQISNQLEKSINLNQNYDSCDRSEDDLGLLDSAIQLWCNNFNVKQRAMVSIIEGYKYPQISRFISWILQPYKPKRLNILNPLNIPNPLDQDQFVTEKINNIFGLFGNRNPTRINVVVMLAFVIVAAGSFIYQFNQPQSQQNALPSSEPYSLILVIYEAYKSLAESIKSKVRLDYGDGEALYKATRFLCQDHQHDLEEKWKDAQQFKAPEESEYDIYLVKVELKQHNTGFNKNVNQLARSDAFRKLSDLASKVEVSDRLTMYASEKFDVYTR